ncbi:MAG: VIT family protein [Bacteroidia bacterium]|nr:VIT family protein [Bacteroidia bacterium]
MELQPEKHYINRSAWLRAAVLGANDGILSTASIAIGVAAATDVRNGIVLASLAGLAAGALSMAAGEYVSVSSQSDIEKADLEREMYELEMIPDVELAELAAIYESRGLDQETAQLVAQQLTDHNALEAHARDELGISEKNQAKPLEAALASGASFVFGAALPLLVAIILPVSEMILYQYIFAIVFLVILGAISAKIGGSSIRNAVLRITFWGTVAMVISGLVGHLFGLTMS